VSAFFTPSQGTTGCGSFQRRVPTGGAAKGIPLYAIIPFVGVCTPITLPPSMVNTGFESLHEANASDANIKTKKDKFLIGVLKFLIV
jgi:hypothetical protein